jgi:ComF family protein
VIDLLHNFKYYGITSLRKTFAEIMISSLEDYHVLRNDFDMVIPIPLHPTKLRERGFNQAELLSRPIAQNRQIEHRSDILIRTAFTPSQTTMEAKQRWTNIHGAFRIAFSSDIADKSILIIDDLLTTAATVNEAAKTLKEAGAAYIGVLTLAVTP